MKPNRCAFHPLYQVSPRKDHRGVALISDAVSNAIGYRDIAPLVWDSVRARHTAKAETAARPSHGRRSRDVMTMLALS